MLFFNLFCNPKSSRIPYFVPLLHLLYSLFKQIGLLKLLLYPIFTNFSTLIDKMIINKMLGGRDKNAQKVKY